MYTEVIMACLIGISCFEAGWILNPILTNRQKKTEVVQAPAPQGAAVPAPQPPELSKADLEKLEKYKQKLVATQEAFEELMNYNADRAYGISAEKELQKEGDVA